VRISNYDNTYKAYAREVAR